MQTEPSSNALRSVFDNAVELPPEQRDRFLDEACTGNLKLCAAVESLLAAHDRAGSFLADTFIPPNLPTAREELSAGTRIGRYVLLRVLGEGGCGIVHLAEQDPPLRRRVALKVIKPGMDSQQVIARFELERQALAMMNHPNIASVFDAGTTHSGYPYFVMELVDGIPITSFCRLHRLDLRARLQLFISTCTAVQHAHEKGVVHRDLKPGNVLVVLQDGTPTPKVIDFGIAKALISDGNAPPIGAGDPPTLHPQFLGTPQYMSPEQVLGAANVDWRSDVYSLGALLYELLAGAPPFDPNQFRVAGHAELERLIREVDPPLPSVRLAQLESSPPHLSSQHGEAQKRQPLVRGSLDRIVAKAMRKDPTGRYESAAALAADIQRHLAGEPVSAPRPIWHRVFGPVVHGYGQPVALVVTVLLAFVLGRVAKNLLHPGALASLSNERPLQPGLAADLYQGQFESLLSTRVDRQISFLWPRGQAPSLNIKPPHYSIIWKGILLIPPAGITGIGAEADEGVWIFVDGHKLVAFGRPARVISHTNIPAGRHVIELRYWNRVGPGSIDLLWLQGVNDADATPVPADALFH